MKLLINGSDKTFSIERFYIKYLRLKGIEVILFSSQELFYEFYNKSFFNKVLFRLGLSCVYKRINREFKAAVESVNPEIIIIFKGLELFPSSLQWVKNRNIKIINYNPDNPFIFSGRGSGNKNITRSIPLYDLYLTYDEDVKAELASSKGIMSDILPFGFDLSVDLYQQCLKENEVLVCCFVGNPDKFRAKFINDLADRGILIHVYGHRWIQFVTSSNVTAFDAVYDDKLWKTLYKYRLQLNIMRPHNLKSHNMRTFEIAGVGGIQLAPDTPDHRRYFKESEEIFLYSDVNDCFKKISHILSLPPNSVRAIREAVREKSINAGYSYEQRTELLYKQILRFK